MSFHMILENGKLLSARTQRVTGNLFMLLLFVVQSLFIYLLSICMCVMCMY